MEKIKESHVPHNILRHDAQLGENTIEYFHRRGSCRSIWRWELRGPLCMSPGIGHIFIIDYMAVFATGKLFIGKKCQLVVGPWV